MNNEKYSINKEDSVPQKEQVRHLFTGLKTLALGMLFGAIVLLITLHFLDLDKGAEFLTLLFYGLASGAFLIGRGRSIILSYEEATREKKGQVSREEREVKEG